MKIVIAFLMAVLASVSGFSQEERPVNPVRLLTAGQHIIPYKIEVTFGKTVHILFPSEVRYVDLGSNNIIAGKADGVEGVSGRDELLRDYRRRLFLFLQCRL